MGNEEWERLRHSKIFVFCEFFSILKFFHFLRVLGKFVPSGSGGVGPCGFGEVTIYLWRLLYTFGRLLYTFGGEWLGVRVRM